MSLTGYQKHAIDRQVLQMDEKIIFGNEQKIIFGNEQNVFSLLLLLFSVRRPPSAFHSPPSTYYPFTLS